MEFSLFFSLVILKGIYSLHVSTNEEQICSKFPYEEQLLEKMTRTEIKVEMMVNEIKSTQDNVLNTLEEIRHTVSEFTGEFADMKQKLTEEMLTKGDEMKEKEELFAKLFEETKTNFTSALDDQQKTFDQLNGKLGRPSIAFYAYHVPDRYPDTKDKVIIFDKTFTNEGEGYDTSTGIFRAPVDGVYQFSVHVCTGYKKFAYIGIVLEDNVIAADVTYDEDYNTCGTVGALVRMKSGEQVWVKTTLSCSNCQLVEDSERMNTFSGMLING